MTCLGCVIVSPLEWLLLADQNLVLIIQRAGAAVETGRRHATRCGRSATRFVLNSVADTPFTRSSSL